MAEYEEDSSQGAEVNLYTWYLSYHSEDGIWPLMGPKPPPSKQVLLNSVSETTPQKPATYSDTIWVPLWKQAD